LSIGSRDINVGLEFKYLEIDKWRVDVSGLGMEFGEYASSFIFLASGVEPSRGFTEEEDEDQVDTSRSALEVHWSSPCFFACRPAEWDLRISQDQLVSLDRLLTEIPAAKICPT
jgi:hypothetical protein